MRVGVVGELHPDAMDRLASEGVAATIVEDFALAGKALGRWEGMTLRAPVLTADIAARAGRLRHVARIGVGLDNVDRGALAARGIGLSITPCNAPAVAEHTLALMLAALRRLVPLDAAVRRGDWSARHVLRPREISGLTVLVVGMGRIGSAVAGLLAAMGARVEAYDPARTAPLPAVDQWYSSLAAALAGADVVTLHCSPQPDGALLDSEALAAMKPGAILVNCARGSLVDADALHAALRDGRLSAAALDVYDTEPPDPADPLLSLPQVVLSPHCAPLSEEMFRESCLMGVENLLAALAGRDLPDGHLVETDAS